MQNKLTLDFGSGKTMPRHVDNIIDTSPNPDIPIGIASGAITGEVVSRIRL